MPGHPGPSTTGITPGRRRNGFQIHQRLTQSLVDRALPRLGLQIDVEGRSPAGAVRADFLAVAFACHNRHVKPHERANVAHRHPVGPDDLDRLPLAEQRTRHLPHARNPCERA